MSSLSRLAIRKFGKTELTETDDGPKSRRVVLYLEMDDIEKLETIATKEKTTKSEVLRRLLAKYLSENEDALNRLF